MGIHPSEGGLLSLFQRWYVDAANGWHVTIVVGGGANTDGVCVRFKLGTVPYGVFERGGGVDNGVEFGMVAAQGA